MTQTLDVHARTSEFSPARPAGAPATPASTTKADKFGTFAITFGIAFPIIYTLFERMNWPLFTYHPAVNKIDFWMHAARSGEGPPMYWYGWLALTLPLAAVVGFLATLIPNRLLQKATLFFCTLAVLWPVIFNVMVWIANRPAYDNDVTDLMWWAGLPALIGAGAATYLVSEEAAERLWAKWLVILPVGGLIILGYSLKTYFTR
jgi:hypothetical protein